MPVQPKELTVKARLDTSPVPVVLHSQLTAEEGDDSKNSVTAVQRDHLTAEAGVDTSLVPEVQSSSLVQPDELSAETGDDARSPVPAVQFDQLSAEAGDDATSPQLTVEAGDSTNLMTAVQRDQLTAEAGVDTSVVPEVQPSSLVRSAYNILYGLETDSLFLLDDSLLAADMLVEPAVLSGEIVEGSLTTEYTNLVPVSNHSVVTDNANTSVPQINVLSVSNSRVDHHPSASPPAKSRKRGHHPDKWKSVTRKRARQNGLAYVSKNGAFVEGKKAALGEKLCSCRLRCDEKFGDSERQCLFDSFYAMDENGKNVYIFKSLKPIAPKSLMLNAKRHRKTSFTYLVTSGTVENRVCKLAYRRLHQISNSKVFHIAEQVAAGLSAPKPDCRGKHATRPHRCSEESLSSVKEHISSFPTESSHYSRACNMNWQYLSSELTIEKCTSCIKTGAHRKMLKPYLPGCIETSSIRTSIWALGHRSQIRAVYVMLAQLMLKHISYERSRPFTP